MGRFAFQSASGGGTGTLDPGVLDDIATPTTPAAGLSLFSRNIAGRSVPSVLDANGSVMHLQPSMGHRQIGMWVGQAASTIFGSFGNTPAPTIATGTGTARTQTSTNILTQAPRTGIVSAAAAGSILSLQGSLKAWLGNVSGFGGFYFIARFGISDAALVATANMFVGLISSGTILNADVAPSTRGNLIGIGVNSGDTTLQLYAAGAVAQGRTKLGASFPATLGEVYELVLWVPPNSNSLNPNTSQTAVQWRVRRLATGQIASGTIPTGATLPDTSTFLGPQFFRSNGGTAAAVGLDVLDMYLEQAEPPSRWFAAWGDSLTAGSFSTAGNDYPSRLAALLGYGPGNFGIGGNTSTQIRTRMIADTTRYSLPVILWAGRNNFNDAPTVEADVAAMVAALSTTNYLVLGITNAGDEPSGSLNYNEIVAINASLAATYGTHYIDIRAFLVSQYDPNQPQDVIDHANDVVPTSLRAENVHLNDAGYLLVAKRIAQSRALLGIP